MLYDMLDWGPGDITRQNLFVTMVTPLSGVPVKAPKKYTSVTMVFDMLYLGSSDSTGQSTSVTMVTQHTWYVIVLLWFQWQHGQTTSVTMVAHHTGPIWCVILRSQWQHQTKHICNHGNTTFNMMCYPWITVRLKRLRPISFRWKSMTGTLY